MAKDCRVTQKLLVDLANAAERILPGLVAKRIRITATTTGNRTARIMVDLRQQGRA